MNDIPRQNLLEELDARQNELLNELENLNRRVEQALSECLAWRSPVAPQSAQLSSPANLPAAA